MQHQVLLEVPKFDQVKKLVCLSAIFNNFQFEWINTKKLRYLKVSQFKFLNNRVCSLWNQTIRKLFTWPKKEPKKKKSSEKNVSKKKYKKKTYRKVCLPIRFFFFSRDLLLFLKKQFFFLKIFFPPKNFFNQNRH